MKLLQRTALAGVALAVVGLLAACSGTASTPGSSMPPMSSMPSNAHNAQDTTFAQMMIVHHKGAVEMSNLADTRADSAQVKDLASQIKAAQQPEIDEMTSWLKAWGEPVDMPGMGSPSPEPSSSDMPGMDMSSPTPSDSSDMGSSMPGMSPEDMMSLQEATGATFDRQFLTLMIEHHQGAVSMAKDELSKGKNAAAKKLAQSIVTSQSKQIADMQSMLSNLG